MTPGANGQPAAAQYHGDSQHGNEPEFRRSRHQPTGSQKLSSMTGSGDQNKIIASPNQIDSTGNQNSKPRRRHQSNSMRRIQAVGVHSTGSGHQQQTKGNRNPHAPWGNRQQNDSMHQTQASGGQCSQSASTYTSRNPRARGANATTKNISKGVACNDSTIAIHPSNATDDLQDDSIEFFECNYCGLSTFDSDSDDDLYVAFALCGSKQRKLSPKVSQNGTRIYSIAAPISQL